MTTIPTPQRTNNQKVSGTFYPLQKEELMALRKARLINNAAYVHLALRFENPFCDRPIEIMPKEFALDWNIPESSVYEALGKLKQKKIVDIKTGKVVVSWTISQQTEIIDCQQIDDSENPEFLQNSRNISELKEATLISQSKLQDCIADSETSENRGSKPLLEEDSGAPQTIQTVSENQTNQKEMAGENQQIEDNRVGTSQQVLNEKQASTKTQPTLTPLSNCLAKSINLEQDKNLPPRVENDCHIPEDLKAKLEELEIPLDVRVRKAIASHHLSQAIGAVAHIENTWETINNPRGVFLFQISRQPVEPLGTRGKVYTARDFSDYTLEHIKKMYPNNWQEAARHFGLEF